MTIPTTRAWDGLCWLSFLVFSTSSFVMIEPSLFEVLFPLLAAALIWRLHRGLAQPAVLQLYCLIVLWVAVGSLSLVFAANLVGSVIYHAITVYMFLILAIGALVFAVGSPALISAVLNGYIVGVTIAAVLGLIEMLHLLPLDGVFTKFGRLKGTYKDPNVFGPAAGFALMLVAFGAPTFVNGRGLNRAIQVGLCFVLFPAVILTFSRASIAQVVFGLVACAALVFLVIHRTRIKPGTMMLVLVVAVAGFFAAVVVLPSVVDLSFLRSRLAIQWYDLDRFKIQGLALQASLTRPFGIGPGGSEDFFVRFAGVQKTGATHNTYLRVLVENGWAALLIFVSLLFTAMVLGIGQVLAQVQTRGFDPRTMRLILVALSVVGLHLGMGLIIDMLHWRHFFIALALLIGCAIRFALETSNPIGGQADRQFDESQSRRP